MQGQAALGGALLPVLAECSAGAKRKSVRVQLFRVMALAFRPSGCGATAMGADAADAGEDSEMGDEEESRRLAGLLLGAVEAYFSDAHKDQDKDLLKAKNFRAVLKLASSVVKGAGAGDSDDKAASQLAERAPGLKAVLQVLLSADKEVVHPNLKTELARLFSALYQEQSAAFRAEQGSKEAAKKLAKDARKAARVAKQAKKEAQKQARLAAKKKEAKKDGTTKKRKLEEEGDDGEAGKGADGENKQKKKKKKKSRGAKKGAKVPAE